MDPQELFINRRYVEDIIDGKQAYTDKSGVLKAFRDTPLTRKLLKKDNIWYKLKDFPIETQEKLEDMAVTLEELLTFSKARENRSVDRTEVKDAENISVYINGDTLILPIVGNILPNDSTSAYTIEFVNGSARLKPILVCWGCHWSELFTGQTKYGNNVFCLASDLPLNTRKEFMGEMIRLSEAGKFLGLDESKNKTK